MEKTHRPNIRKLFLADPGKLLIEADLKQADAGIVAWESGAAKLQDLFIAAQKDPSIDLHKQNALVCYGSSAHVTEAVRQIAKRIVHGTNFGGSAREIAHRVGLLRHQVEVFQHRWFGEHPQIKQWHRNIEHELQVRRSVTNIFGYRRIFFERVESIVPEAIAWKPQSTTALTINEIIRRVRRRIPCLEFLMQVHDSALWQVEMELWTEWRREALRRCCEVELAYKPRPLTLSVDLKVSLTSWGDMEKIKWKGPLLPTSA